mgnify:CR=1 FL=1
MSKNEENDWKYEKPKSYFYGKAKTQCFQWPIFDANWQNTESKRAHNDGEDNREYEKWENM